MRALFNIFLIAAAVTIAPLQAANAAPKVETSNAPWAWEEAVRSDRILLVRIVRGNVAVVRRPGPLRIEMTRKSLSDNAAAAAIEVEESANSIMISDRYPARSRFSYEDCLPPTGKRGDFWTYDISIETTVFAPEGRQIQSEIGASND